MTSNPPSTTWGVLRRSVRFWFGVAFLLAALGIAPVVLNEKHTYEALLASGQTTPAAVMDHGERQDNDDKTSHWLRLQYYDLALKEYTHDQPVSQKIYDESPVGSTIQVRYLRDNPDVVKLETALPEPEWKDVRALALTFALIGVMIVGLSIVHSGRRASAQRKLAAR